MRQCVKTQFRFPKPKNCPVCFCSIHQAVRPLACDHWVHRSCVRKSGKAECPICRKQLPDIKPDCLTINDPLEELLLNPNVEQIEIPRDAVVSAVIAYQLYAFILRPAQRVLGLDHFISGLLHSFVPLDHPSHPGIATFLYAEALELFFNPAVGIAANS